MKRILQIGMTRNIGGLETYLMNQFRKLDRSRTIYDFVNITGEYQIAFADEIERAGSKIFDIPSRRKNPLKHYLEWIKLFRKIRGQYDAIILNANSLSYVFPIFAARFFGISRRIFHSHNSGDELKMGTLRKILVSVNKFLLESSVTDRFACSEKAGRWMFGSKKFHVINNAIDAREMRFNPQIRDQLRRELEIEDRFVLAHVGRFTFQKNHEFLIEIFAKVAEQIPDSILLLIGDAVEDSSFLDRTRQKVSELKLEDRVKFLGLRKDVRNLMQAFDCFVLPSRFEGLPMVGIEAQSAGLPCVFSDTITRELEITQNLVQYVKLDSIEDWCVAIQKARQIPRRDTFDEIANAGYDISTEILKLEKFFEGSS